LNVSVGRARLANSTAFGQMIKDKYIAPKEARLQMIADGMITISIPEDVPLESEFPAPPTPFGLQPNNPDKPERPGVLGSPILPSAGGHGEVRSFVSKGMSDLKNIFKTKFENIIGKADGLRVKRLVRKAIEINFPFVRGAVTQLSSMAELKAWLTWTNEATLKSEYDENTPDVVIKFIESSKNDMAKELEKDEWWKEEFDLATLYAVLLSLYEEELRKSVSEVVEMLYLGGMINNPNMDASLLVKVSNEKIEQELKKKSKDLQEFVNSGTVYYLVRSLLSSSRDGLSSDKIRNKIREGIDLNTILDDNDFVNSVSQSVLAEIRSIMEDRIDIYSQNEQLELHNKARHDEFKRIGLTRKHWKHNGSDEPCNYCTKNIAAGWVEMDYKYESPMGAIEYPPAHPKEHCEEEIDKNELYQRFSLPNFKIWTGE